MNDDDDDTKGSDYDVNERRQTSVCSVNEAAASRMSNEFVILFF